MFRLHRYPDARAFLADAEAWLTSREAEHNLILGLSGVLAREPAEEDEEAPYFAVVASASGPVAAALRTPPMNLLLSEVDDPAALGLLADDLAEQALPGAIGPPGAVDRFGQLWTARHGGRVQLVMDERIYRLSNVVQPRPAPGAARRAGERDRDLLTEWMVAFHDEALPQEGGDRARRMMADWDPVTGRQFWIWENGGRAVSLVGAGGPTPRGIRIGPVYTPAAERGHGYASNLTAHVSRWNLEAGRRFCFLYTNLANRTANRIYAAIGYEPVTDARMVRFSDRATA